MRSSVLYRCASPYIYLSAVYRWMCGFASTLLLIPAIVCVCVCVCVCVREDISRRSAVKEIQPTAARWPSRSRPTLWKHKLFCSDINSLSGGTHIISLHSLYCTLCQSRLSGITQAKWNLSGKLRWIFFFFLRELTFRQNSNHIWSYTWRKYCQVVLVNIQYVFHFPCRHRMNITSDSPISLNISHVAAVLSKSLSLPLLVPLWKD